MNALVTGANRGIGLELVKQLAERGETVWAVARRPQESTELVRLSQIFDVRLVAVDLLDPDMEETFQETLKSAGHLDLLINNAGLGKDFDKSLKELSLHNLRGMLEVNSIAPLRVTRVALPYLLKADYGKVASLSSSMGSIEDNHSGAAYGYRMSKTALNMFNKCLALEQPKLVCVVLHPGWVQTEMGGRGAPVNPHDSARGLLQVIDSLTPKQSGQFFDYQGAILPW